ncbi:MAG: ArgE/DapE family deacylase [Gemmatimonadetes bacterium]|nr:ArgE/DapE family deacylase [Gemmatimonadota bacterium]
MTGHEAQVMDAIDGGWMLETLQRLVRIPSEGGSEEPAQDAMARLMTSIGLDLDRWEGDVEDLRGHPDFSAEIERTTIHGLVGCLSGGGAGRTLVLNGHVDVVPPGDVTEWSDSPWSGRFDGSRIHGRGAADMKGGLVSALGALKALQDAGAPVGGTVLFHSVVGEEDGGAGTLATVLRGHRGDGAVVMEPTGLAVVPAHAGSLSFRIRIRGRGAHGALRLEGVSAAEKLGPLLGALRALEQRRNKSAPDPIFETMDLPFPISVGTVQGGSWASTVPDSLVCEGRYGVIPGETLADARREFEEAVRNGVAEDPWLSSHPPSVEWWGGVFRPVSTPVDDPVVTCVGQAAADVLGHPPVVTGLPCGTDLRHLVHAGETPGVLFGPGDLRLAHAPDESVALSEVVAAARVLALTILRFCAGWSQGPGGPRDPAGLLDGL